MMLAECAVFLAIIYLRTFKSSVSSISGPSLLMLIPNCSFSSLLRTLSYFFSPFLEYPLFLGLSLWLLLTDISMSVIILSLFPTCHSHLQMVFRNLLGDRVCLYIYCELISFHMCIYLCLEFAFKLNFYLKIFQLWQSFHVMRNCPTSDKMKVPVLI